MGIKKRSKVNAEFNMSSMTDIIFLLLIFFMLTSNLVAPNALNLKLPGRGASASISSTPTDVAIDRKGNYKLDGRTSTASKIERALRSQKKKERNMAITISPADKAPVESVVAIMDIAMRYQINAILATEE
ncbi:MAG: biopolymer transport protein ExbD [Polaribacter sp.]|jgi:biopolymer transport protein ExbD